MVAEARQKQRERERGAHRGTHKENISPKPFAGKKRGADFMSSWNKHGFKPRV